MQVTLKTSVGVLPLFESTLPDRVFTGITVSVLSDVHRRFVRLAAARAGITDTVAPDWNRHRDPPGTG